MKEKIIWIWNKILNEDILFKPHRTPLEKNLDIKKTLNYFLTSQKEEGYFHKDSPMIYDTFYFCGILNCINKKPSNNTIEYIKSLQVGSLGFGETTGENPWTDKAYLAIRLFDWFKIPVQKKEELISFFQNFQNKDGGFGSLSNETSNLHNTLQTIFILSRLNTKPINIEKAITWLRAYKDIRNPSILFSYIQSSKLLDFKFSNEEKKIFTDQIHYQLKNFGFDYGNKYYCIRSLLLLDQPIEGFKNITENILTSNPKENYYLANLLSIFNKLDFLKDEFLSYVKQHELIQGGFSMPNDISTIKNGFMAHSLYLIGHLDKIDKNNFLRWLKSISSKDGWGPKPSIQQYHEYTVTSLIALKLCLNLKIENKTGILKKTKEELKEALDLPYPNNYHVLRTIKNSLERLIMLNEKLDEPFKITNKIMGYSCKEGGFGGKTRPYLYATLWGIRSLYLCEKYMKYSNKLFFGKLNKIKKKTSEWIKSCQNKDGGFGPMPNQPSNIQSTFCAHYSLWMLNEKPNNVIKAIEWLLSLQREDGGFAGSRETESEMLHILYAIGSLSILTGNEKL